jgi:CHAT domain-containing protein/Flp pilus assembly protein TadD
MILAGRLRSGCFQLALVAVFLLLIPLKDTRPETAHDAYGRAWKLFQHGRLADCQLEAGQGYRKYQVSNPDWAAKFQLLEAEAMVWRGMYEDALQILAAYHPSSNDVNETIRKMAVESSALVHQQQLTAADQTLTQADRLCMGTAYESCGYVLRTRGNLAIKRGQMEEARQFFLECLLFARVHQDRFMDASASLNLGWVALQINHYDEAIDWSKSAYKSAVELGAEDKEQITLGNLGWAYFQLGDDARALEQFLKAEKVATRLGDLRYELKWISDAGYVYHDTGDLVRATQSYRQALDLAKQIDSNEDIVNALEDLAQVSVETGKPDDASAYLAQIAPMQMTGNIRFNAYVMLTKGMLAAAQQKDQQAEALLQTIQGNVENPISSRLSAGDELAKLFERQGKAREAERVYKATLNDFESARAQLRNEDSRLPFASNANGIYDNYIHLLVQQGRSDEALALADQSRARTLAQGLGVANASFRPAALNPRQIAHKTGATLLFYWLGDQHSYLWAVTPSKIALIELPAQGEIVARVERYRKALLDVDDPLQTRSEDGQALYKLLVAPAMKLIRSGSPVMILADGELSKLNFETLLVPGATSENNQGSASGQKLHYLLEDATLLSAPSLAMLSAAKPARHADRNMLLLGNPVSPDRDYPSLPLFGSEMAGIERHFSAQHLSIFAGPQATPASYLTGNPAQYSYIHFVSHAVASRTDPLDSAIILSGSSLSRGQASEDSFKLYARDIMQHPIDARLVTISACYGSGTRSYAGEGLVGLSWAFLRAGAHSVIGALWEVSDDSTPQLMDALYQGIEKGQEPAVALRNAKLALLHSQSRFRAPFYWAPFQIYTRR